jgi:hypothetical protein
MWDVFEVDLTHEIAELEYVIHASLWEAIIALNEKRQGWPDIQRVARRCSRCANKSQIEATR